MSHSVCIERRRSSRTSNEIVKSYVDFIVERALGGNRGKNWQSNLKITQFQDPDNMWVVQADLKFKKTNNQSNPKIEEKQWRNIARFIVLACNHSKFGKYPWRTVRGIEDNILEAMEMPENIEIKKDTKDYYTNLSLDPKNHFNHIYDRDKQIQIILCALNAAIKTDFVNRFHCVLFGAPGCGKSDLLISTAKMLGEENKAWMKFDATSTTEAGASRILLESETIAPVLIVEEIEKTDEKSLRWMLGILDQRAEIRRTNFKIGNKARNVKMLVLATVNDIGLFRKVMSGALASRFPNEIYCPRPSREILAKILLREVEKVKGRTEWIEPTLQYCYDENHWDDPRKLVPICLQGMDGLLNGSYQVALDATRLPAELNKI